MGSGKKSSDAMVVYMIQQQQAQQRAYEQKMAEQKQQMERANVANVQTTNANQKPNALSTTRQDNAVRSQGMVGKDNASAVSVVKNKLGGAVDTEEQKKEGWY